MVQGHCDGNMGGIYPAVCTGGYPPKSARLVALMGGMRGLIFRGQAAKLHLAAMSAFPESGRSDTLKSTIMKGRFRSRLCENVPDLDDNGTAHHIGNAYAENDILSPTLVLFRP